MPDFHQRLAFSEAIRGLPCLLGIRLITSMQATHFTTLPANPLIRTIICHFVEITKREGLGPEFRDALFRMIEDLEEN